jgi:3-dehydroquinate dehydratase-2
MKILVINGPNINMLGIREPDIYGKQSFSDLLNLIDETARAEGLEIEQFQSNHEGAIVDEIQKAYKNFEGIVINPGAYTHTSIAILDALKSVDIPTVEVHISNVKEREEFRQISYVRLACIKTIIGHGTNGYIEAIDFLNERN